MNFQQALQIQLRGVGWFAGVGSYAVGDPGGVHISGAGLFGVCGGFFDVFGW